MVRLIAMFIWTSASGILTTACQFHPIFIRGDIHENHHSPRTRRQMPRSDARSSGKLVPAGDLSDTARLKEGLAA